MMLRTINRAAVWIALASACFAQTAPKHPPATSKPNIILITVDTLRADHLGAYGSTAVKTPAMDALAQDGILFENAASQVPLTLASHASILTGTYPFYNGVQDFTGEPLDARFQSVAQAFQRHGYSTAASVSAFVLDRSWGLSRGFDHYDDSFPAQDFAQKNVGLVDRRAKDSVDKAIAWVNARKRSRPFFLWLHLYDPHSPYDPPEPFRTQYKDDLYSGEIAYADSQLARFFAYLRGQRLYDGSGMVLLSDHGESLGEHGEREHGFFIYTATTHVPLIIKPAGRLGKPARIGSAVEAVAVGPTLLELAGIRDAAFEKQAQASSLLRLLKAEPEAELAAYSETYYPFSSFGWSPLRGLRSRDYQYIEAPQAELYSLPQDAAEQQNLLSGKPAVAAALKSKLTDLAQRYAPAEKAATGSGLSADAIAKLRALGYVAYKSPATEASIAKGLPDPKSKVEEFNAILKATDAMEAGDFAAAKSLLAGVEASDPEMYLVPFLLGESALRQNDAAAAVEPLQRALKLNPQFDQAMTALARAYLQLGRTTEAEQWLDSALKVNPQNFRAWYQLAFTRWRAQDLCGASEAFAKALAIQPGFALAERDWGMLLFQQKRYTEALPHLAAAISRELADKQTLNTAGIAANQLGKTAQAVAYYQQALRLDPDYAEAHLNLGLALRKLGRDAESKREYKDACRLEQKFCSLVPAN
jgi:arylsulfatase A-like enzyme/Tfp pilus assembly protein PilF